MAKKEQKQNQEPKKAVKRELKKITGLWKQKSKRGNSYLSGFDPLTKTKYIVLANKFKKNQNQPDYILYIVEEYEEINPEDIEF